MGRRISNEEWADSLQERFWSKVDVHQNGCWQWTGAKDPKGYGRFNVHRSVPVKLAHRVAFALEHGRDAKSAALLHECDNPSCVNPDHLREGSYLDNQRDAVAKGRNAFGERCPAAKLTSAAVVEMRKAYASGEHICDIAHRHGVSRRSASQAVAGETWKSVREVV